MTNGVQQTEARRLVIKKHGVFEIVVIGNRMTFAGWSPLQEDPG